jgi:hypothetical protein
VFRHYAVNLLDPETVALSSLVLSIGTSLLQNEFVLRGKVKRRGSALKCDFCPLHPCSRM